MSQDINLGGTIYISSRRGAQITGYSQDYIGQLARSGAIEAHRVSGLWYVLESSLVAHKEKAEQFIPTPPQKMRETELEVSVSFGGKDYISATRASEISGYNSDYVTQLAREGKIVAHQSGNRWFVDRESLLAHKHEKDSLLAAVQSDAVGIRDDGEIDINIKNERNISAHYKYVHEEREHLLPIQKNEPEELWDKSFDDLSDRETPLTIRILQEEPGFEEEMPKSLKMRTKIPYRLIFFVLMVGIVVFGAVFLIYEYKGNLVEFKEHVSIPEVLEEFLAREIVFSRRTDF